jgi:hypothetical protein
VVTPVRLADVVAALGGALHGDDSLPILRLAPLESADAGSLSFLANPRYAARMAASAAACVVVAPAQQDLALARGAAIVTPDPYLYFARLTQWWAARTRQAPTAGIHPSAVVEPGAQVHASAAVGALAYVGAGACIGAGAVIGTHGHIGAGAVVGDGTRLAPLGDACVVGARGILHSGVVIGADGFGFAPTRAPGSRSSSWARAHRRRRRDRRQHLHRPWRARRHRDRRRRQARQPDPDRPQRAHRRAQRHGRLRGRRRQRAHRPPLHAGGGAIILGHLELVPTMCTSPPPPW